MDYSTDKQVLVSIIVPNYNHGPFLSQRMESILAQTYSAYEIVLLDDASHDDSPAILERYRSHPKVVMFKKNSRNSGSPYKQWYEGLQYCNGQYVWIAESDDACEAQFLDVMINALEHQPRCQMAMCASQVVSADNQLIRKQQWQLEGLEKAGYIPGSAVIESQLIANNEIVNVSAVVFRYQAVLDACEAVRDFNYLGDWYAYLSTLQQGMMFYSRQVLNCFRLHANTTRAGLGKDWVQLAKEYRRVSDLIDDLSGRTQTNLESKFNLQLTLSLIAYIDELVPNLAAAIEAGKIGTELVIYGHGALGLYIQQVVEASALAENVSIRCFLDKLPKPATSDGIPVYSLDDYAESSSETPIIIASIAYYRQIQAALQRTNLERWVLNQF